MKQVCRITAIVALLAAAGAADAHHSYAMFDLARVATVQGKLKVVEWTNPHVWLWIDGDAPAAGAMTYAFETVSPGELMRFFGWNRTSFGIGQKVTIEYAPLRSGKNGGAVRKITFADGRVLETPLAHLPPPGGAPPGGPPPGSANATH